MTAPFSFRKSETSENFRNDEKSDEPTPHQESKLNIMPNSDESEDSEIIRYSSQLPRDTSSRTPTKRNINISNNPAIETTMPTTPEGSDTVIIAHTTDHVFGGIDTIEEGPEAEEAPGEEEFQPDVLEVVVAEASEFRGGVGGPVWLGFEDGDHVEVMNHDFHG